MQQPSIPRRASRTQEYPANPHRAGYHAGIHPEDQPYVSGDLVPTDEEEDYPTKTHTSTRRYMTKQGQEIIEQGNRRMVVHYEEPRKKFPWISLIGIGMIVSLLLVWGWSAVGAWWQEHQLDATYGFPRTYQTDAIVYPGDTSDHPSHYIFLNLGGTVQIIEEPHGDVSHAKIYKGPTLFSDNAALIPVTGTFTQVNGKEEMIVHIGNQEVIYVNDGTQFKPQQ